MNPTMPSRQIESFAGLPTSDRKARRLGIGIVGVTFGLFGTWAALAPLDGAAFAPGVGGSLTGGYDEGVLGGAGLAGGRKPRGTRQGGGVVGGRVKKKA